MKLRLIKISVILLLFASNLWLLTHLKISSSDIDGFFPSQNSYAEHRLSDSRFLFVHEPAETKLETLQNNEIIQHQYSVPSAKDIHLLLFNKEQQSQLLNQLSPNSYMGSPLIGSLLSTEFLAQTIHYLLILIPVLIPLIIILSSRSYLAILTIEILLFIALLLSSLYLFKVPLNPAYLLSLLFILLYSFTTIKQLHFNEIETRPLIYGIAISIFTTWISAWLLSYSQFGIINDFGQSLMIWLVILSVYLAALLFFRQRNPLPLQWFRPKPLFINLPSLLAIFLVIGVFSYPALKQNLPTQFNPLLQSEQQLAIQKFEAEHLNAQPILLQIQAGDNCRFLTLECNQKLHTTQQQIFNTIDINYSRVADLDTLYQEFSGEEFSQITPAKFAQFKLALELSGNDVFLYSSDYKTAYLLISVSLLTPIADMVALNNKLTALNQTETDGLEVSVYGRLNDMVSFKQVFFDEMWIGISLVLLILITGITLLYKDIKATFSLIPAVLSLMLFGAVHSWLNLNFTVMSLVALILFVGLIADNIIHILMAYKTHQSDCFKLAFKPIFLSNFILVISLSLVVFLDSGFLKVFGLELALLLALNLTLTYLLMPTILKLALPNNSKTAN